MFVTNDKFFLIEFQLITFSFDNYTFYHQIKTLIGFWCRLGLNLRYFIQLPEIDFTG